MTSHILHGRSWDILDILDHKDMFFCCAVLPHRSVLTASHCFHTNWISYFDAPSFVVDDRYLKLSSKIIQENLFSLQCQLCPISKEALWSLGANERSHAFLHKGIYCHLLQTDYISGHDLSVLLSDVCIAWNLTLHTNKILPHHQRFCVMSRVFDEFQTSSRISDRQHLMMLAREATSQSHS